MAQQMWACCAPPTSALVSMEVRLGDSPEEGLEASPLASQDSSALENCSSPESQGGYSCKPSNEKVQGKTAKFKDLENGLLSMSLVSSDAVVKARSLNQPRANLNEPPTLLPRSPMSGGAPVRQTKSDAAAITAKSSEFSTFKKATTRSSYSTFWRTADGDEKEEGTGNKKRFRRKLTKMMTLRFSRFKKQSSLFTSSKAVPPVVAPNTSPLCSNLLADSTVEKVRTALNRLDNCPLTGLLKQAGCYEIVGSDWTPCPTHEGTEVRKCVYMVPIPDDIPSVARRLLNIPDQISSASVWRLYGSDGKLVLVQHSYTRDVLYGDRFKVQSMITFQQEGNSVKMEQWVEVLWDKPLPWTHSVVTRLIESRARTDGEGYGEQLAHLIEDALAELDDSN
eukprot:TRINITY_DN65819_c0_g1_i1.p1 TRINITY_DN65819_c0_g1~~TRINITY_DN65819_c0_g1_i1.p1  ORF type:complete len:394 (+),score=80.17 TRINITY_DN65819_c0_g1_i1:72-1253(+)